MRRHLTSAAIAIPVALFATGCGLGNDWATQARDAADSPVGNSGEPNTGLSAQELRKRIARADRETRNVRSEFSGTVYGVGVSGESLVNAGGDLESRLRLKDKEVHVLRVGTNEYARVDQGMFGLMAELEKKSPSYDPDDDEQGDEYLEFAKLMEGKYLKTKASKDSGSGLGMLDALPGAEGFSGGDNDGSADPDDDFYGDEVTYTLGELTTVNGVRTIPLISTTEDGDGKKAVQTTYVPAHGPALPIRVTSDDDNDGKAESSVDTKYFTLHGDTKVTAPPADLTVDMEKVMEGMFGGFDDEDSDSGFGLGA